MTRAEKVRNTKIKNILGNYKPKLPEEFGKLKETEKRVEIAKDVLLRLKTNKFNITSGVWVDLKRYIVDDSSADLRDTLLDKNIKCDCCALGGMMLSCTFLNDKATCGDFDEYGNLGEAIACEKELTNEFNEIFSKKQLMLIEYVFEGGIGRFNRSDIHNSKLVDKCNKFNENFAYNEDLIVGIMENIINNNGTFKP